MPLLRTLSKMGGIPPIEHATPSVIMNNKRGSFLNISRIENSIDHNPGSLVWALRPIIAIPSKVRNKPTLTILIIMP